MLGTTGRLRRVLMISLHTPSRGRSRGVAMKLLRTLGYLLAIAIAVAVVIIILHSGAAGCGGAPC